jgi:hypothetical protein
MRLFVIEVLHAGGALAGYAVAERVDWIPADADRSLYPTADLVGGLLKSLMDAAAAGGWTVRALPLPSTDDRGGRGSMMFMSSQFMASEELQAFLGRRPSKPDDED